MTNSNLDLLKQLDQTFSYQLDIVLPNLETTFSEIQDYFLNETTKNGYYLLTNVCLDELLNNEFIETFVKNGECYLYSFGTQLDSHDCVCLQPNGNLTLSVCQSTNERIPIECIRTTAKNDGISKYEILLNLNDYKKNRGQAKMLALRAAFARMYFSFYCTWKSKSDEIIKTEQALKKQFNADRVFRCLNRVEACVRYNKRLSTLLETTHQDKLQESSLGCLINDIPPELVLDNEQLMNDNQTAQVTSILRIKGFIPNSLIHSVLFKYISEILERLLSEQESRRVLIKAHGFVDCPIRLTSFDETTKRLCPHTLHQARLNKENFINIDLTVKKNN